MAIVSDGPLSAHAAEWRRGQSTATSPLSPAILVAAGPESDCRLAGTIADGFILLERAPGFCSAGESGNIAVLFLVLGLVGFFATARSQ